MFCKHEWKVLSETTTQSKFECALGAVNGIADGKIDIPSQMACAVRKYIQIVSCDKCGKLKRFVEDI